MSSHRKKQPGKRHDPSNYRALLREMKRHGGRSPQELVRDARELGDPYYVALALIAVSAHNDLKKQEAQRLIDESFVNVKNVPQAWRRAEVLGLAAKELAKARDACGLPETVFKHVPSSIDSIEAGNHRSAAITSVAPRIPPSYMKQMLGRSFQNAGFEQADAKAVIRAWIPAATKGQKNRALPDQDMQEMVSLLYGIPENRLSVRLLGYLHFQLHSMKVAGGTTSTGVNDPAAQAMLAALGRINETMDDPDDALDALRYLVSVAGSREALEAIAENGEQFADPTYAIHLFTAVAGTMDKIGESSRAGEFLQQAFFQSEQIDVPEDRARLRTKICTGFNRLNDPERAQAVERALRADCDAIDDEVAVGRILSRIGIKPPIQGTGLDTMNDKTQTLPRTLPESSDDQSPVKQTPVDQSPVKQSPLDQGPIVQSTGRNRHILALHNAYEGGLKLVHLRTIARTAPLCMAFDLDLALIEFPGTDPKQLVRKVINETNIGKGGNLLKKLAQDGRIHLIPKESDTTWTEKDIRAFPGIPVATTSKPDSNKSLTMREIIEKESKMVLKKGSKKEQGEDGNNVEQKPVCIIMGLGKKGLPASLLEAAPHHLELTGVNVPLETCTVMGIIVERLRALRDE